MTTIIIDCNKQRVCADKQLTTTSSTNFSLVDKIIAGQENREWISHEQVFDKIAVKNDNLIIVGTGRTDIIQEFSNNYPHNIPLPVDDTTLIYCLKKRNKGILITEYEAKLKRKYPTKKYYWSIDSFVKTSGYLCAGSGGEFARAIMQDSGDIVKAISIASQLDVGTSSEYDLYEFGE